MDGAEKEVSKQNNGILPFNFHFAQELPSHLKLERAPMAGDTTTWNPSVLQFHCDDD
jgi:hypothetical protein